MYIYCILYALVSNSNKFDNRPSIFHFGVLLPLNGRRRYYIRTFIQDLCKFLVFLLVFTLGILYTSTCVDEIIYHVIIAAIQHVHCLPYDVK